MYILPWSGKMRRLVFSAWIVVFATSAAFPQAAAASEGCYCLDNFLEVRFLWNCRDDSSSPEQAICTRPGSDGTVSSTQVELTEDWDRYEAGTPQCPANCLPPDMCSGGAIRGDDCPK